MSDAPKDDDKKTVTEDKKPDPPPTEKKDPPKEKEKEKDLGAQWLNHEERLGRLEGTKDKKKARGFFGAIVDFLNSDV